MLGQHRLTDLGAGPCCITVTITGSMNVYTNMLPTARLLDLDIGYGCPACVGVGILIQGSGNVYTNSRNNHRLTDLRIECCGPGIAITASNNVYTN